MNISVVTTFPEEFFFPSPKPSGRRRHKHKPGDEGLCKYASKACYTPRSVKKTGELHRYCHLHRMQANRNQRRLEQRRRLKELMAVNSDINADRTSDDSPTEWSYGFDKLDGSVSPCSIEPFDHPVPLFEEDLSFLQSIFVMDQQETTYDVPVLSDSLAMYQI